MRSLLAIAAFCGLLGAGLWSLAEEQPAAAAPAKRAVVYGAPEEAFLAYQGGIKNQDAGTAYEAITPECQDTLLFDQWADEYTGESGATDLSKFIDAAKRRLVTVEALPTQRRDLPPLFVKMLSDKRAAFAAIIGQLDVLRSNSLEKLRVANIKIEGDKATSDLWFKDQEGGPGSDAMHFVKDTQGWLVDLRPDEDFMPKPTPAPGTRPAPAKLKSEFQSPAEAFTAFKKARRGEDVASGWHALTPRFRNNFLFVGRRQLLGEYGDNLVLHWYGDLHAFTNADTTNPLPTWQEDRARAFAEVLYDPQTFFAAILKGQQEIDQSRGRRVVHELGEVKINGDRGHGMVTTFFEAEIHEGDPQRLKKSKAYTLPCYFQKGPAAWQIDLPTTQERTRAIQQEKAAATRQPADAKRSITFASPEEVYAAYTKARLAFDAETVRQCFTPASCDALLFVAWSQQFHFLKDPPTLHEFVDEELRRQLTRERLPVLGEELPPLLLESIRDRRGAFAAVLHTPKLEGELKEVKAGQTTAKAKLVDPSPPPSKSPFPSLESHEREIAFFKDSQGWLIDVIAEWDVDDRPTEERLEPVEKQVQELKPRQPKPWTGKPAPRYGTPQEVHTAQSKAFMECDPETVWHCLTERKRNEFMQSNILMLVEGGGGDEMIAWYADNLKFKDKRGPHELKVRSAQAGLPRVREDDDSAVSPAAERWERQKNEQEHAWEKLVVETIYDPQAYFSAVVKRMELTNRRRKLRYPDLRPTPLEKVVIQGDRAYGVVQAKLMTRADQLTEEGKINIWSDESTFEVTGYFAKVDGSWRLDVPSQDEHIAQWRKDQEATRRSREEAEKKRQEK